MRKWFDALCEIGPIYGYYPKPSKCILLSKPDRVELAKKIFCGSGIDIQTEGNHHNRNATAVGTEEFKASYVKKKVDSWVQCVKKFSLIAATEPHAAYAAFTHCLQSQWTFLCRTMPGSPSLFQPLEDAIRMLFIPALLRREVNDLERDLISLPARMGGLGISKPTEECLISHTNSLYVSAPLVRLVKRQEFELEPSALSEAMLTVKTTLARQSRNLFSSSSVVVS